MSCGCLTVKGRLYEPIWAERSAMCQLCPDAEGSFRVVLGPTHCGLTGRTCADMAISGGCPHGDGRVRAWMGLDWVGVPYPIRLFVRLVGTRKIPVRRWRGCGCVRPIKVRMRMVRRLFRKGR